MTKAETSTRSPLTPVVFHVLLALADGQRHGYAIMRAVERTAGAGLSTGPGMVYGSLQRMEDAGLVREGRKEERRRNFQLTRAGRRALEAEACRLAELGELVRARKLVTRKA